MRQGKGVLRLRVRAWSSGSSRNVFGDIASEWWLLCAVSYWNEMRRANGPL